jgi:3-oxoacyl-[acyl-carrier protein] reductase
MKIDLTGKNALVTGGASGIGRECATVLAEAGARVAIVDINLEGAQETARQITAVLDLLDLKKIPESERVAGVWNVDRADRAFAVRCDLADPEAVAAMREAVLAEMGGVDILVNCAGVIIYRRGVGPVSVEEWDLVLDVNLRGTYLVCREFIENMKARRDGRIILFSSLAARVGGIEVGIHYAASKAGLIGFTRTLAKEGGPYGITVNAVAPGIILTEPVKRQVAGHEDDYVRQIPLRRLGEPSDVANVILFLASPLSSYITGACLDINGGMYMG